MSNKFQCEYCDSDKYKHYPSPFNDNPIIDCINMCYNKRNKVKFLRPVGYQE